MTRQPANRTTALRRRWSERGAQTIEFALIAPVFILLLCGLIDCGLMYGGYLSLESGVGSGARLASVGQYTFTGTCGGGPTAATAQMVCNVAQAVGKPSGADATSLRIGICFAPAGNSAPSCAGQTSPGTSGSQDVEVCAQDSLESSTGVTALFFNGRKAGSTSRLLLEEPQPSASTAFAAFNASSQPVTYGSTTINGLDCS